MAGDMTLIDMSDPIYQPMNDATRQVVFSEAGRGVHTVIVDGRVVVRNRRIVSVDEGAIYDEINTLMPNLRQDYERVRGTYATLAPYYREVLKRALDYDLPFRRLVER